MKNETEAVLRFRDGRISQVNVGPIDETGDAVGVTQDGERSDVAYSDLKAVFFPRSVPEGALDQPAGSVVTVEFRDGEIIRGTAHLNPEHQGFFLYPLDRSKNERIFVVSSAISSIEVEKL